jgi:putative iron-regulated protein
LVLTSSLALRDPHRADAYFRDLSGRIVDQFTIFAPWGYHLRAVPGKARSLTLACALALPALTACRERASGAPPEEVRVTSQAQALAARVMADYAELAFEIYDDSLNGARGLASAVDQLLAAPSAERLQEARRAWLRAREPYVQSEVFRFYGGPIDRVEMRVNTWPIDESYVESGLLGKAPGIIENEADYPVLSESLLAGLNVKDGETSVSTGYHVVEFLLWGADTRADGPGERAYTDYVASTKVAARRGQYLRLVTAQLVQDLAQVRDAWAPDRSDNYRAEFGRLPALQALARAVKGLGSLSGPELAGERLTVPYATKDQENEQSCFSDTTSADIVRDALGIENVCLGRYQRSDGTQFQGSGLCVLIAAQDPALAAELTRQIEASVAAARRIPTPFDQAILGSDSAPGRRAIEDTIAALQRQATTLAKVATVFGLKASLVPRRPRP